MTQPPIEDYALLADRATAALVSRTGSIDWLCLPRLDSEAVFAALLGEAENGRWLMAPADGTVERREYLGDSFVLRTTWRTPTGRCEVTEFMPQDVGGQGGDHSDLVRMVRCTEGHVTIEHELRMRFAYGRSMPWVRRVAQPTEHLVAVAGPEALLLRGPLLHPDDSQVKRHVGSFQLAQGEQLSWSLVRFRSWDDEPTPMDPQVQLQETLDDWSRWAGDLTGDVDSPAVRRSMLVLRALTNHETGGVAAAATTSLPELWGGERNWDYRYVWLRDSALTIEAMLAHGVNERSWRDWLLRAIAGDHADLRIMYGLGGERIAEEEELDHLAGYGGARPVRIGNGAKDQYQADVVGEVMIALRRLRESGVAEDEFSWSLQRELVAFVKANLDKKDHGIWEMRGEPHFFTHGRVMMWAALDCAITAVEEHGLAGDVQRWRELRDQLRAEVDEQGVDPATGSFTMAYDNAEVDASLLMIPHTGFCAWDDPRMLATVQRIEAELVDEGGFVHRYRTDKGIDGLEGGEYGFVMCTFWLVEIWARTGRLAQARELFERVAGVANDLGLLAEEYDVESGRMAGNYPQAFSHLGLVQAAEALRQAEARQQA